MAMTRILVLPALLFMLAGPLSVEARTLDAPKAPPAEPVYEVDPGDRTGYSYVIGHWEWTGDRFMWSPGKWVAEMEGSVWVNDSWALRGKKWHLTPGHYEPDGSVPPPVVVPQNTESKLELLPERPDTAEEVSERTDEPAVKGSEMDDVEQKVLAPSSKPLKTTKASKVVSRKVKHPVKKPVADFNDPSQYPYYKHH